jgi:heme-degrading monooxygenase HmoA
VPRDCHLVTGSDGPMIVRIWRTDVRRHAVGEYQRFANERSLPMFRRQPGCLGVWFARQSVEHHAVITLWRHRSSVQQMELSPGYRDIVSELLATDVLVGGQEVDVFEVDGGAVWDDLVFEEP